MSFTSTLTQGSNAKSYTAAIPLTACARISDLFFFPIWCLLWNCLFAWVLLQLCAPLLCSCGGTCVRNQISPVPSEIATSAVEVARVRGWQSVLSSSAFFHRRFVDNRLTIYSSTLVSHPILYQFECPGLYVHPVMLEEVGGCHFLGFDTLLEQQKLVPFHFILLGKSAQAMPSVLVDFCFLVLPPDLLSFTNTGSLSAALSSPRISCVISYGSS